MESEYSRVVAGVDVHKKVLAVVVVAADQPEIVLGKEKFGSTVGELRVLADWLGQLKVTEVAMESTAQYWRPVWLELEGQFRLYLAQARSTAAPKGRKWDFRDALRIVKRLLGDDLTLSFVPEAEQREWRLLTRARTSLSKRALASATRWKAFWKKARLSSPGSSAICWA